MNDVSDASEILTGLSKERLNNGWLDSTVTVRFSGTPSYVFPFGSMLSFIGEKTGKTLYLKNATAAPLTLTLNLTYALLVLLSSKR